MRIGGIYKITAPSGNFYIGSSKDLVTRKRKHLSDLRAGRHCNINLQRAFAKYGEESMKFEIMLACPVRFLIEVEQFFIDDLMPAYNISKVAGRVTGYKLNDTHRAAVMASLVGVPKSIEHRTKLATAKLGKKRPAEVGKKISASKKGVKLNLTEEQRRARSARALAFWAKRKGMKNVAA